MTAAATQGSFGFAEAQAIVNNTANAPLFTCLSCQVAFKTADNQRTHYRGDWHRYNLKRKVAELPPVTYDDFTRRVNEQQSAAAAASAASANSASFDCTVCRKSYSSDNQYQAHLKSKKHKETEVKAAKNPQPAKQQQSENAMDKDLKRALAQAETEDIIVKLIEAKMRRSVRLTPLDCLFCNHASDSFENNMEHMKINHSFYIPDREYLVNERGLIKYLGEKITVANVCLYCNGKGRGLHSLEAVRAHMTSLGHCKIAYDNEVDIMEIADYYDFRPSYPDYQKRIESGMDARVATLTGTGGGLMLDDDGSTLILPNGKKIGHRSLQRYYKQRFEEINSDDEDDFVVAPRHRRRYEAMKSLEAAARERGMDVVGDDDASSERARDTGMYNEQRKQQNYQTRIGIKANKLQRHFRDQLLQ
ncbi:hypothetical protein GQ42DRAFT_151165 [Ramicandelaber brevisporus]|nr:hypothetical protein GQ42DRAFT_151165 [Ramicandelaber brevisporus]